MSARAGLEKYHEARAALLAAQSAMLEATKAAWPIGMQVISNKFCTGPIACTVVGYREWAPDLGSLVLQNNRSGKTHQGWPYSCHNGVWGVEPA